MFGCNFSEWGKFTDACICKQNVQMSLFGLDRIYQAVEIISIGDVGLNAANI